MQRTSVASSSLRAVGYERESATLEVEFANGRVYRYFMVPAGVVAALFGAESLGRYFNEHIRERFPCELVE